MNHSYVRQPGTTCNGTVAACTKCGQVTYVAPLHDERGGPLFCFHVCRRMACRACAHVEERGAFSIKALKAYDAAGGSTVDKDFRRIKIRRKRRFLLLVRAADDVGDDFSDLTSELLDATIALTHPDKHPIERKAEANRVTQELHALKPFVFPAPPPKEPEPPAKPRMTALFNDGTVRNLNNLSRRTFPVMTAATRCPASIAIPARHNDEKKQQEDHERDEKKRQQNERAPA